MDVEGMVAAADAVIDGASELAAGFTTITDISKFKPANPEAAGEIKRALDFLAANGAARAILVTGGKGLGKLQFDRMRREVDTGYEVIHVETLAEAESLAR